MTDQKINQRIAEACGWTSVSARHRSGRRPGADELYVGHEFLPDYCSDLNAMHEAEKVLDTETQFMNYYLALYDVTQKTRWPVSAPARQRAEAFLRVMDKWEEVKG